MKLQSLLIQNFKGIRSFELSPLGNNISIYGDNGTGKSTVADAYFWLLTGKDSTGQAKFDIYPKDSADGINVSVTAAFVSSSGDEFTLQRIYKKVFERKNGESDRKLKGNTTDYFISGTPKPLKEYNTFIEKYFGNQEKVTILTDPDYFPHKLDKDARRAMLIKTFAPHYDDSDVIKNHEDLSPLSDFISVMTTVEELAGQKKAQRKKINFELSSVPGRIDENDKARREVPPEGDTSLISKLAVEKQSITNELVSIRSGENISTINTRINSLISDQAKAEAEYIKENFSGNEELDHKLTLLRKEKFTVQNRLEDLKNNYKSCKAFVDNAPLDLQKLRSEYSTLFKQSFSENTAVCPSCGQMLPEEKIQDLRLTFNENKSKKLEKTQKDGKNLSVLLKEQTISLEKMEKEIADNEAQLASVISNISVLSQTTIQPPAFNTTDIYIDFCTKIKALKDKKIILQSKQNEQIATLQDKLKNIDTKLSAVPDRDSIIDHNKRIDERIKELMNQEKSLGKELAKVENLINLTDIFVKYQADDITDKVNNAFAYVSWQLFEEQINGGTKTICEATVNGIKYNDTLNTASKLNAGLDIINTLTAAGNFEPLPIFVDNAESVTGFTKTNAQIIKLYVSAFDSTLRTEVN